MTDKVTNSDIIIFSLCYISAVAFLVYGILGQYHQRKRKHEAIFIIPMRRIYFWFACALTAIIVIEVIIEIPFYSGIDLIITTILFTYSIGMAFWFSSSDIIVSKDGIYSFMKYTRRENIASVSKDGGGPQ